MDFHELCEFYDRNQNFIVPKEIEYYKQMCKEVEYCKRNNVCFRCDGLGAMSKVQWSTHRWITIKCNVCNGTGEFGQPWEMMRQ